MAAESESLVFSREFWIYFAVPNANDDSANPMIVFLHIPKTAGSTFQFILENSFGVSACHTDHNKKPRFTQDDFDFARMVFPGMKSLAGHNLVDPLSLTVPDPFHITFLREPVARVFSNYQDTVLIGGNTASFEADLRRNEHLENFQVKVIAGGRDLDRAKRYLEQCRFVGLTEKFDLSLSVLGKLCPYRLNPNYKRRRTAPANDIKKSLENDPRIVDMAREHNRLDLELYDFARTEIFPKFCAQAGFSPEATVASYDKYTTDDQWRYRLCHAYNLLFYRSACKLRRRP